MPGKKPHKIRRLFGENVRAERERQNLSQEQLAERAHLGQQYISDVELGKRNLGIDSLAAIAESMSVSPGKLLGSSD